MSAIEPGMSNETKQSVEEGHLASKWGSGLAPVLATPVLVAFFEECSRLIVDPRLPPGQQTVGTGINLRHLAATPSGMQVTIRSELIKVDRRRLSFRVEAWDDAERIGEAEHERYIIDVERFQGRVAEKARLAQEMAE